MPDLVSLRLSWTVVMLISDIEFSSSVHIFDKNEEYTGKLDRLDQFSLRVSLTER